ncbi:hypothetical protein F442_00472 [Phytophthora nicotianae P10297]|uniref:Uncharacterized protein n=3 Tax=Phytophthora nicotianae TaxID=4792 RepID=W2RF97_PHYN3|nr:hypothetical protein PPTG_20727 [Phytophthora nicotianae INRA-310]ETI57177.1 hypothetical protein F443_00484 [Phytophthora nicotianae P1569]ETN23906.1 hypothetical protein PPTG_20727 [Phytophthora nicotianae INRA-310]ETP54927.1 hypothetical protein F442_00472 [Phytophthora nicotianae P10297]
MLPNRALFRLCCPLHGRARCFLQRMLLDHHLETTCASLDRSVKCMYVTSAMMLLKQSSRSMLQAASRVRICWRVAVVAAICIHNIQACTGGQFAQLTRKWTHQRNDFKQYVHEAATGLPVDT